MVLRSLVGALVAVALIGAVAAALPERLPSKQSAVAPAQQFGELPKPQFSADGADGRANGTPMPDRQVLLKLAAYPVPPEARLIVPPLASAPPVRSVSMVTTVPTAQPVKAEAPQPQTTAAAVPTPPTPQANVQPVPPPQRVAALPPSEPPVPPSKASGAVNINKASVAELDHIPGGGRIGLAIARRRPYRSVDDLVRKRVLRETAFERIKSAITVD